MQTFIQLLMVFTIIYFIYFGFIYKPHVGWPKEEYQVISTWEKTEYFGPALLKKRLLVRYATIRIIESNQYYSPITTIIYSVEPLTN